MLRRPAYLALAPLFVAGAVALGAPEAAHACSCMPWKGPIPAMESSSAVFLGTVEAKAEVKGEFGNEHVYTVTVEKRWKGEVEGQVEVRTADNSAACGIVMETGTRYLVFASGQPGQLSTGLCSYTKTEAQAKEAGDFDTLGAARGEAAEPVEPAGPDPMNAGGGEDPLEDEPADPRDDRQTAATAAPPSTGKPRGCDVGGAQGSSGVLALGLLVLVGAARRRRDTVRN